MAINAQNKDKLKLRLTKILGHLDAVYRMVDDERYCVDVLHQIKAVQAALDKVSEQILKQHLETCVVDAIENQDTERVIDELVQVFRKAPNLMLTTEDLTEQLQGQLRQTVGVSKSAAKPGCCSQ